MVANNNTLTAMGFKRNRGGEQHDEEVETRERGEVAMETEEEEDQAGSEALAQTTCDTAAARARLAANAAQNAA
jgi:hypothetical protein